jgi:Kef-type K+ transport system membrane component KefB
VNELLSLGIILLFALLAGHLVKVLRVPEVTGYIFAGVLVGPSVLDWIRHDTLAQLHVFSEVALGLILFSIGSVFEFSRIATLGRTVGTVSVVESLLAASLVTLGTIAAGQPLPIALLLGAIAIETAAASTLMVIRECNSTGPLTETLTGVIALNNILALLAFNLVSAGIDLSRNPGGIYEAVFPLIWQIAGAVALGYLVGLMLAAWASHVIERGEVLILLAGCVLLCVGGANFLGVSPLVATLSVGATMVNLSSRSRGLFEALAHTDPPLYAIFFVIAGADLNLALLPSLGVLGGIYVVGRMTGKFVGARVTARRLHLDPVVQRYLGFGMLSQAGLAIGLILAVGQRYPDLAPTVSTVVLAGVAVFEIIGPVSARYALVAAGETKAREAEPVGHI